MKDAVKLMKYIIGNETKFIEAMRHSLKEDEFTILRLQNKSKSLEKQIEERKQLIKEYRSYLGSLPKSAHTRAKLIPATRNQMDSGTLIESVESIEKQA